MAVLFWAGAFAPLAQAGEDSRLGQKDKLSGKFAVSGAVEGKVAASRVASGMDMRGRIKDKLPLEGEAAGGEAAMAGVEVVAAGGIIDSVIAEKKKTFSIVVVK